MIDPDNPSSAQEQNQAESLNAAARKALEDCLNLKENERVVIIANPEADSQEISWALYHQSREIGAKTTLLTQEARDNENFTEVAVLGALKTEPDVFISISTRKLGKDPLGSVKPYVVQDFFALDKQFNHLSQYLIQGKQVSRGFWSPGVKAQDFIRSVNINYSDLRREGQTLSGVCEKDSDFRLVSDLGTDLRFSLAGRKALMDLGDYSKPGQGGNLPVGELILSPALNQTQGVLVLDRYLELPFGQGVLDIPSNNPLELSFKDGRLNGLRGRGAEELEAFFLKAEADCLAKEDSGAIAVGFGHLFKESLRALGDLSFGLNPCLTLESSKGISFLSRKARGALRIVLGRNSVGDLPGLYTVEGTQESVALERRVSGGWEKLWG
jgi:aminopeptidase